MQGDPDLFSSQAQSNKIAPSPFKLSIKIQELGFGIGPIFYSIYRDIY